MKLLVVLSVLVAGCMAVPQIPTTFQTKMSVEFWNGSMLTFMSSHGYMAQDYFRKTSIMCVNETDQSSRVMTWCYVTMMRSTELVYIYYVKLAGEVTVCDQTYLGEMDFVGVFDWVVNSMPIGQCYDTCQQELEEWQYNVSDISTMSVGVSDYSPDTPVFFKTIANLTSTDQEKYIGCFNEFTREPPPYLVFAIPENCQSAPRRSEFPEMKYSMAHHMLHKIKLNHRIRSQL